MCYTCDVSPSLPVVLAQFAKYVVGCAAKLFPVTLQSKLAELQAGDNSDE